MLRNTAPYSYKAAHNVPQFDDSGLIAIMDETCGLCSKGARWIAHSDARQVFKIVPIQSELGVALAQHYGVDPADPLTWLVLDHGVVHHGMDATIHVGRRLGGRWRALTVLKVFPRGLRDWAYGVVARNRYRVMGRADLCNLPDPEVQKRLLR